MVKAKDLNVKRCPQCGCPGGHVTPMATPTMIVVTADQWDEVVAQAKRGADFAEAFPKLLRAEANPDLSADFRDRNGEWRTEDAD